MHDELTQIDIDKMKEELRYRSLELRPKILEDVKTARGFGDLSENAEYHEAKRERSRNESRIRYLTNMIKTAVIVDAKSNDDEVGMFDTVEYYVEDDDETEKVRIVTALRQDVLNGIISNKSPVGSALMGHKVGDRVCVTVNSTYSYYIVIRSIKKGTDDASLDIRKY